MPAATMAWVAPSVLGGLGLLQSSNAQKKQEGAVNAGLNLTRMQGQAMADKMRLADAYDAHADTTTAVNRATDVANSMLARNMQNLVAQFGGGGQAPGMSSDWAVRQRNAQDAVMDPLKQFVADQSASEFTRKMNAYTMAAGGDPSQVADNYFRGASAIPQTSMNGSLQTLMSGLSKAFGPGGGSGSSGSGGGGYTGNYGNSTDPNLSMGMGGPGETVRRDGSFGLGTGAL